MNLTWIRGGRYDIIVDRSCTPVGVAYPNPKVTHCLDGDSFMGATLVPSKEMTPELWQRAIGLVVCGLAERYQQ